jgi:hypothetical protein
LDFRFENKPSGNTEADLLERARQRELTCARGKISTPGPHLAHIDFSSSLPADNFPRNFSRKAIFQNFFRKQFQFLTNTFLRF